MPKIIARTYDITNTYRLFVTYTLFAISVAMILFYVFNIYKIVSTSISVSRAEAHISDLENQVQNLDSKYLELSNKITPELVRERGMAEGKVSSYISRTSSLGVVSLGSHGL